ncbi:membrane protein [Coprinopsis cinerea AmutBmut pab1-1]|nr:membrane protein [Coprinopsis cinerea AmutBmut pab1-1]
MLSVGALIWISFRPLLRLIICAGAGYAITKADIFPLVAARGASQVILYIAIPCLLFSKIVPSFNADNIRAFGPLVLVASLYEIMGIASAWIIKQFFWVPHRFRNGILVAGGWGNVGDIPTSVIMSVTAAAPFNAATDQDLSVAYISVFILVFTVSLFPMGGHRWIAKDYEGPEVEHEEVQDELRAKRTVLLSWSRRCRSKPHDEEKWEERDSSSSSPAAVTGSEANLNSPPTLQLRRSTIQDSVAEKPPRIGDDSSPPSDLGFISRQDTIDNTVIANTATPKDDSDPQALNCNVHEPASPKPPGKLKLILAQVRDFVRGLLSPPSIAICVALPISLVPKLKALFVPVAGVDMPSAPDGLPPLAFVMDATIFIGAASVPLGLICLGSALARLNVPRNQWKALPLGAISSLAVAKLLIMPILGVLIVQGLVRGGVIPEHDRVLRFVCIFCSCLPTATTQVYLTQVYSGTGSAEHLSAFLIPQYILMFFSMTALTAYTIQLLF